MNKTNKILLLASFLGFITLGLFGPIYAIFVKKIGGDVLEAGIAYGLFSIVSGIFVFSIGRLDFFKQNLRQAVFIGFLLFTLGNGGFLFVSRPLHLFIVQIILGVAGGILEPSWDGLFSKDLTEQKAAQFWSTWAGARDVATGIGAMAGGVIVAAYSFHLLFLVMLSLNITATLVSFLLVKKGSDRDATK
jgi:MFS family permease